MKLEKIKAKSISCGARRSLSTVSYIAIHYAENDGDTALTVMKNGNDMAHLKGWAMSVVRDLEKSFPMWDGEKKKRYAVAFMRDVADAKKIKITDASLGNLVEAAVRRVKRK